MKVSDAIKSRRSVRHYDADHKLNESELRELLGAVAGVFARAGSPLLTFVSFEEVWVEAYMKENNIANIDIGDPAEISLDLYPGRIFNGVVASISHGRLRRHARRRPAPSAAGERLDARSAALPGPHRHGGATRWAARPTTFGAW